MKTSQAMPTGTTPVATRLDARLLARSEASAKRLGLTMSGLLQVSLSTYLDGQDQLVAVDEIAQAAAAIRDAVTLLNNRDSSLAARVEALTEALKSVGSEAL